MTYFSKTEPTEITLNDAYWCGTGIVLSTAYIALTYHPYMNFLLTTACKVRVGCSGLVYQKSLRILKSSTEDGQNGQIINIMSNDLSKMDDGFTYLYDIFKGPLEAITYFVVIYNEIGISSAFGMIFLASFIPLQGEIQLKCNLIGVYYSS